MMNGSRSVPLTNGSGSGRPKNSWILQIRIQNTAFHNWWIYSKVGLWEASLPEGEEDDGAGVQGGRVRHHHQLRVREKPTWRQGRWCCGGWRRWCPRQPCPPPPPAQSLWCSASARIPAPSSESPGSAWQRKTINSGDLTSVADPWHVGTDPDPRMHASDKWIRILLFS